MTFLIQQTMIYAVPLMIVALAGVFAERSGIINLALEGIMILGAFIGVLFVNIMQTNHVYDAAKAAGDWVALQGFELLAMLVAAIFGAIFSLLLSFASVNLRADQTIGGTALNLMAPALVLFLIRIIANQNTLQMATGDAASWFMIKKTTLGYAKTDDLGFLGNTFLHKVYLATYVCIIIFVVLSILLYVAVSLLTCRKPFDFDRMLHRGKYNLEHHTAADAEPPGNPGFLRWKTLLGITPEYTRGDRILAYSVLAWTLLGFAEFLFAAIVNLFITRWSNEAWFLWWEYITVGQGLLYGVVTTVWFTWGGLRDLRRLFRHLKNNQSASDDNDDGRIVPEE